MAAFTSWCFLASFALLWGSTLAVEDAIVLKPLHAKVFERSVGLNIRSEVDFSTLSPADQALLAYGEDGGDGRYLLANMTLYAPNGLKIVMMERFEELTSAVDCEGDDGIMSLTFKSPEAFDQALKEWAWINTAEEKQFLLIANHEGCGPDDERQAYIISYVDQQEELFKTVLSAKPAPWDEIAGTFDLDFGSVSQESIVRRELNAPRGWGPLDDALDKLGDVAEGAKDVVGSVVDKFEDVGDLDIPKSVSFGVNAGSSGQRTTLYKDSGGTFQLDCVDCFLSGNFRLDGRISTENFQPKAITLGASPSGVKASLIMEVVLKKSVDGPKAGKNFLNKTTTLFSAPIPGAGIKVPKIFKLGAAVQLDVGTGAKVTAEGNFTMGLTASLNDGAKVTTDLINSERSSQTGLGVDFDPIFQVNSLKGSVSVSASAQPKLTFGIEIVKVGRLDAYLGMKLPEVTAQLDDVIFDKSGACSSSGSKSGIKLTSSINVGVNVGVDASLGKTKAPVIDHELWGRKFPLLDKCLDVGSGQKVTTTSTSLPPGPTPATVPKGKNIPQR